MKYDLSSTILVHELGNGLENDLQRYKLRKTSDNNFEIDKSYK